MIEMITQKPLTLGGLGIRSMIEMNEALQGKWPCRFRLEQNSLWRRMVALKYGMDENEWFTRMNSRPHRRGLWKNISKATHVQMNICWKVEKGDGIILWEDSQLEGSPFSVQYLQIYTITQQKESKTCETFVVGAGGGREWQILAQIPLNDQEIGDYERLPGMLS